MIYSKATEARSAVGAYVIICEKCGGSCIKNGLAVRKQRWKCSKCGKGFYTEVEDDLKFVDPFKALKGKWVKCVRCGIETVNDDGYCNGCQVLIEGADMDLSGIDCDKIDSFQREFSSQCHSGDVLNQVFVDNGSEQRECFVFQKSEATEGSGACFVGGYDWESDDDSLGDDDFSFSKASEAVRPEELMEAFI